MRGVVEQLPAGLVVTVAAAATVEMVHPALVEAAELPTVVDLVALLSRIQPHKEMRWDILQKFKTA